MTNRKLISVNEKTKEKLDSLKLCTDESYNSLLERVLPKWAQILKSKLEEEVLPSSPITNERNNTP